MDQVKDEDLFQIYFCGDLLAHHVIQMEMRVIRRLLDLDLLILPVTPITIPLGYIGFLIRAPKTVLLKMFDKGLRIIDVFEQDSKVDPVPIILKTRSKELRRIVKPNTEFPTTICASFSGFVVQN